MIGRRAPRLLKEPGTNRRLTVLDCEIGGHSGHFSIMRIHVGGRRRWGCAPCIAANSRFLEEEVRRALHPEAYPEVWR